MRYCVIKNTTKIIDGSYNGEEVMLENAFKAGFTNEQVEILTQEQFDERKSLEPKPIKDPSEKERIAELEQIINMILMGDM